MIKRPIIDPELAKEVQDYANQNFNGNFTMAVDALVRIGLEGVERAKDFIFERDD